MRRLRLRVRKITHPDRQQIEKAPVASIARMMAETAHATLAYARSYTGDLVWQDGSMRPRHPDQGGPPGWADRTGTLASRYGARALAGPRPSTVGMELFNTAPHASLVQDGAQGNQPRWVTRGLPNYFHAQMRRRMGK